MGEKPLVQIENWYRLGDALYGEVQDHPRFAKGESVKTSLILHEVDGIVETNNTFYKLGTPYDPTTVDA